MTNQQREAFHDYATKNDYDTAHTYDTERSKWVYLNPMTADLWRAWQAATLAERERCAKVCEALGYAIDNGGNPYRREANAIQCAAAIRAG